MTGAEECDRSPERPEGLHHCEDCEARRVDDQRDLHRVDRAQATGDRSDESDVHDRDRQACRDEHDTGTGQTETQTFRRQQGKRRFERSER